jgi:dTDP-4-amino-4,6-dideoxygalactose transaminase
MSISNGIQVNVLDVEFFSFSYAPLELRNQWIEKFSKVIQEEGVFIGGKNVIEFENDWANANDSKFAIGVSNGFDGLTLALRSLGIEKGWRVAVPAHTFIATWNAVISLGATPIGVDVDDDGLMDLEQFHLIAPKVQAVIPVHMHGSTVDMNLMHQICTDTNLVSPIRIVEDASQAHGALNRDGSGLGKYSDAVVYSLYPTKNLGALGDAGIVTTNSQILQEKIRSLSNYGSSKESKYSHEVLGFNNRLDPIQAAVLSENLKLLNEWNSGRRELSNIYITELSGILNVLQTSRLDSVRHHLCVLTPHREELKKFLISTGIKTEIHYPNVAGIEALRFLGREARFPKSEEIAKNTLSLPLSQWHNTEQILYVISQIKTWIKS